MLVYIYAKELKETLEHGFGLVLTAIYLNFTMTLKQKE